MRAAGLGFALVFVLSLTGCQATRAVWCCLAEGLVNGMLGTDEDAFDQADRESSEAEWKQFWTENPTVNTKMTEAYSNE